MKRPDLNNKKWNYTALAFFLPMVSFLFLMIIRGFTPFGQSSMLYSDCYHQYFPFFKAFRHSLLSGDSLLYNWDVGMGLDYLGLISYYLASPLNLLSVLLPESWLLPYFTLLTPIKMSLASFFFAFMLKKLFRQDGPALCIFGTFYGMCAWTMGYQWNIMWVDTFALLPLVVLGTVYLLRDKRFVLYTLALFLSIAANYYIGLFTCIFTLLFFICYQICCCKSVRRFFSDLVRIAFFSILAIGMTLFLELPALAALQNTQSSVNNFPTGFRLNIADENTWQGLLLAMGKVASNLGGGITPSFKEGLPNLYCGVGTVLLSTLWLTDRQISVRKKLCAIFLLLFFNVSFIIRQLDYIWHGFHFTNMIPYRFSFLYSFVLLMMAYQAWLHRKRFHLWQLLSAGIFSLCIFLFSDHVANFGKAAACLGTVFSHLGNALSASLEGNTNAAQTAMKSAENLWNANNEAIIYVLYNGIFLIAYFVTMLIPLVGHRPGKHAKREEIKAFCQTRRSRKAAASTALLVIFSLELFCNLLNYGIRFPATNISYYPRGTKDTAAVVRHMKAMDEDSLFYRSEVTHTQTLNDGALLGYNGISTFTSSANVRVTQFMKALGYSAKNTYNRYCFEDSSPVANLFLNLKYMIEREPVIKENEYFDKVFESGNVSLLKNNAYLPLGFLTESALAECDFFAVQDTFSLQNHLFADATGLEGTVWHSLPEQLLQISSEKASITDVSSAGYCAYSKCETGSKIIYTFSPDRAGLMCIDIDLTDRNSYTVKRNGESLYTESISLPQMISVGNVAPGDSIEIQFNCKDKEDGHITVHAAVLDSALFRAGYEKLAASPLVLSDFSNTRISGSVHCPEDSLLYTSIPHDGNWSVEVDGTPAEITLVGNAMIGVLLPQGEHHVVFSYHNAAFSLGWKISLACALILGICTAIVYVPSKRKGKFEKKNSDSSQDQ